MVKPYFKMFVRVLHILLIATATLSQTPDSDEGGETPARNTVTKIADPVHEGDPVHTPEFKAQFEHVDGTITSKVLKLLHSSKPVSSGALPPAVGVFFVLIMLGSIVIFYMHSNECFKPRDSRALHFVMKQLAQQSTQSNRMSRSNLSPSQV